MADGREGNVDRTNAAALSMITERNSNLKKLFGVSSEEGLSEKELEAFASQYECPNVIKLFYKVWRDLPEIASYAEITAEMNNREGYSGLLEVEQVNDIYKILNSKIKKLDPKKIASGSAFELKLKAHRRLRDHIETEESSLILGKALAQAEAAKDGLPRNGDSSTRSVDYEVTHIRNILSFIETNVREGITNNEIWLLEYLRAGVSPANIPKLAVQEFRNQGKSKLIAHGVKKYINYVLGVSMYRSSSTEEA